MPWVSCFMGSVDAPRQSLMSRRVPSTTAWACCSGQAMNVRGFGVVEQRRNGDITKTVPVFSENGTRKSPPGIGESRRLAWHGTRNVGARPGGPAAGNSRHLMPGTKPAARLSVAAGQFCDVAVFRIGGSGALATRLRRGPIGWPSRPWACPQRARRLGRVRSSRCTPGSSPAWTSRLCPAPPRPSYGTEQDPLECPTQTVR